MKTSPKPTNQTETPAAAPVTAAQPAPAVVPIYEPSSSGRVSFLLETASKKERDFFYELLDEWEAGYDLTKAACLKGAEAQGISWISEIEDITAENKMFCGLRLVMLRGDWFLRFLRRLLESYDYNNPLTPDDVADDLDSPLITFQHEIRDARNLIENHPETVVNEIREAVQKRPDLLSAA